jgi:WhiB family redox-sensing transcriptional regulator
MDPQTSSQSWRDHAACKGMGNELFYPARGQDTRAAKQICYGCPVRLDCFDYGFLYSEKHGIWGGFSERQMIKIRRNRKQATQ